MKKLRAKITFLLIAITLFGCNKEPDASFTTNKSEYIAGDTVHLKNTSSNGHSFVWALPDGQKATTTDADYPIPRNQGFDQLTFILNAYSKKEKKSSSITKTVNVIPASTFSIDSGLSPINFSYKPLGIVAKLYSTGWGVNAYVAPYNPQGPNYNNANAYLSIKFPNSISPLPGIYTLQSNDTLTPGTAYAIIRRLWWEDNFEDFVSLSGQLNVNVLNGKLHIVFSKIDASRKINQVAYPGVIISGDITVP